MSADVQAIQTALSANDKKTAQRLLIPLLKLQPTADLWVLAAKAANTQEQAIDFLRRALALDAYHNEANRLLLKIEGVKPLAEQQQEQQSRQTFASQQAKLGKELPALKQTRRKPVNWGRRLLTLLLFMVFSASCTAITLNLVGVITGPVTAITVITGGPQPVTLLDGVPIGQIDDAVLRIEPSQVKAALQRDTNVLDPGYVHAYTFNARDGETYAIYVQFLSVTANRVSRNVALVSPNGGNRTANCQRDQILQGDNNIVLTCTVSATGEWTVRVLGRENESVGVYFIGVDKFSDF